MDPPSESASSSSNSSSSQAAQWLRENFEYCSDSHIAREKIYQEYLDICASRGIDVLNSASFGKVIRMIFPHVATRRLGTRGNSKYHYLGIKPIHMSDISISDIISKPSRRPKQALLHGENKRSSSSPSSEEQGNQSQPVDINNSEHKPKRRRKLVSIEDLTVVDLNPDAMLPIDEWFNVATSKFPAPLITTIPVSMDTNLFVNFLQSYRCHCRSSLQLAAIGNFRSLALMTIDYWKLLPIEFHSLFEYELMHRLVCEWDMLLFQHITSICIPDLLTEVDGQAIGQFQQYLANGEMLLDLSLTRNRFPRLFVAEKSRLLAEMTHLASQYRTLNQLAGRLTDLIENHNAQIIMDMISTWREADFEHIIVQSFSICPNVYDIMRSANDNIIYKLENREPITRWAEWIFGMIEECVSSEILVAEDYVQVANQFLMRWSYIASLVLREIKDRDPQCLKPHVFESFNLLKLFIDDYMKFAVDCKYEEKKRMAEMAYHQVDWQPIDSVVPLQLHYQPPPPTNELFHPETHMEAHSSVFTVNMDNRSRDKN